MKRAPWAVLAAAVVFSIGCGTPKAIAPPAQVSQPEASRHMFFAADPNIDLPDLQGIRALEDGRYRWTDQSATVKLRLNSAEVSRKASGEMSGLRLHARFWTADAALKSTGPIEVTFRVNGHEAGRKRYASPGEQVYEAPVRHDWLVAEAPNEVSLSVDHVYSVNGVQLGVALAELGFVD